MPQCKTFSIYCIKCIQNGKVYIGKSADAWSRMHTHYNALSREADGTANFRRQHADHFVEDFKKYGAAGFVFQILQSEINGDREAREAEMSFIDAFNSWNPEHGYNVRRESLYGCCDGKVSQDFAKKIKKKLIDVEKNQTWLVEKIRDKTGLYCDSSYLSMILNGKKNSPRIKSTICEILEIEEEL